MPSPLSISQKRELVMLAREAFALAQREARETSGGIFENTEHDPIYRNGFLNSFDEWRHEMVARAVSKNGLTCCSQDDYGRVKAQFLALLGRTEEAQRWRARDAGNPKRVADNKIRRVLGQLGAQWTYAEGICRRMFHGLELSQASDRQTWKVYFALNKELGKRKGHSHAE